MTWIEDTTNGGGDKKFVIFWLEESEYLVQNCQVNVPNWKWGCIFTFEWINKSLGCLQVHYTGLQQNLHHLHVYSGVPHVNRGETSKMRMDTPDSR